MKVYEKELTVTNPKGVHSRVATKLIKTIQKHNVKLQIFRPGHCYECSSVLDILSIALVNGASFTIKVEGREAAEALLAVEKLMHEREDF